MTRTLEDRLFVACGLAWAAGLIHIEAAIEHSDESVLYVVLFALLAATQLGWGVALYRGRRVLAAGVVLCLGVVVVWALSRTTGLPIGPDPWQAEPVGAADLIATADEVAIVLLALSRRGGRLVTAGGTALILLSSIVLMLAGHFH
jgi:hypothetical protein